jgi:transcription elongation factor GreB
MADARDRSSSPPASKPVPNYITPAGYRRLADELTQLHSVERPRVVQEVSDAAAQGDRSENAEYIYGKRRLREIDRRMRWLSKRLEAAVVVDPRERRGNKVFFGATVVLEDQTGAEQEYQLVGEDEIDTTTRRISWRSPVGSALLGRSLDDDVQVKTPAGVRRFTIVDVRYQ